MTKVEIMALEGRALDAAIAERVCGWILVSDGLLMSPNGGVGVPRYSTDLNACREAALVLPSAAQVFYVDQLQALVAVCGELRFKTVEADAATRCRAMLLALEGKDE